MQRAIRFPPAGPVSCMKVALVTGASSGIGAATARVLAADGFAVVLAARRAERLEALAASIRDAGGRAEPIACDLEQPGAPARLVAESVARLGRLDVLVNNAGRGFTGPIEHVPEDEARRIFNLNLVVPFLMTSAALLHLKATGGVIINVASAGGLLPSPFFAAYSASKAALVSLSDSTRLEASASPADRDPASGRMGAVGRVRRAPRVRVVAICPGPVKTEFAQAAGGAPVHADELRIRVQASEEIARIILRNVHSPGRTVPTTLSVRGAALLFRLAPRLFDRLVLAWARKIGPQVRRHFEPPVGADGRPGDDRPGDGQAREGSSRG